MGRFQSFVYFVIVGFLHVDSLPAAFICLCIRYYSIRRCIVPLPVDQVRSVNARWSISAMCSRDGRNDMRFVPYTSEIACVC